MGRRSFYLSLFVALFLTLNISHAQFNDYGIKGGVQGFGLLPYTEFDNDDIKLSYLGRGFLRIELISLFDIEIGAGYGILAGVDRLENYWETSIIPADVRILFSPYDFSTINPYAYAGVGVIKWKIEDKPLEESPSFSQDNGYDLNVPLGLGMEIKLTNSLLLDISGGYNIVISDDINYYNNYDIIGDFAYDGFFQGGIGLVFTGESGSSDTDQDGLSLDQEREINTDPENSDSDSDGLIDGLEFNQYKTDPLNSDSDNDGLTDSDEVKTFTTNPNKLDTDDDGINDGEEINNYKTDPLRNDSDFDGISDKDEISISKTDPTKSDTDNDGLKDGDERDKYKTSPSNKDSDEDGLTDGDEILKYNTNPTKKDTDGGTTDDKVEIERGSNPLNPEDDVVLDIEAPMILDGVTFASGSSELSPESEVMLLRVLNTLNTYPDLKVEITGYTDNVGSASLNAALSQRRANSVRYWILNKGVDANRVVAKGFGEQNPIADNKTKEGRRLNRRIEFSKIQ